MCLHQLGRFHEKLELQEKQRLSMQWAKYLKSDISQDSLCFKKIQSSIHKNENLLTYQTEQFRRTVCWTRASNNILELVSLFCHSFKWGLFMQHCLEVPGLYLSASNADKTRSILPISCNKVSELKMIGPVCVHGTISEALCSHYASIGISREVKDGNWQVQIMCCPWRWDVEDRLSATQTTWTRVGLRLVPSKRMELFYQMKGR